MARSAARICRESPCAPGHLNEYNHLSPSITGRAGVFIAPVINPLQTLHEQAEATFLPYGPGVQVVESYGESEAEYAAIRKSAALMDAPHRSVAILTGKDRLSFLHNKVTNNTLRLTPGQGCYAYLLNLKGRIVMDLNILQTEEATLVELDRRLCPDFLQIIEKYLREEVRLLDGSKQLGRLTVRAPKPAPSSRGRVDTGVETLDNHHRHAKRSIGKATVTIASTTISPAKISMN